MATEDTGFNATATTLSRNPLGIIALFIVLVYAMAALTIALPTGQLSVTDKTTMVWFLVLFPVLVLGVFTFLVGWRTKDLYAPSDFTDQKDWVDLQKDAVAQLTAATVSNNAGAAAAPATSEIIERSTRAVEAMASFARSKPTSNGILWVDDNPDKVAGLRRAFENFKIPVTVATGTDGALSLAAQRPFDAIVTDMEHDKDPTAGYALAEKLRTAKVKAPVIIFTSAKRAAIKDTRRDLVSAVTSSASDLFQAVMRAAGG